MLLVLHSILMGLETTDKGNENNQENKAAALQREPKNPGILQKSGDQKDKEGYDWVLSHEGLLCWIQSG